MTVARRPQHRVVRTSRRRPRDRRRSHHGARHDLSRMVAASNPSNLRLNGFGGTKPSRHAGLVGDPRDALLVDSRRVQLR